MGPIDPRKTLYFKFGEPIAVELKARRTHQRIVEFIAQSLIGWGGEVKGNAEFGIRHAV